MKPSRKKLSNALKPVMKAAGYTKHALTWHRTTDSAILVLNVQGSQWSDAYYLNAAVYFRELGDESHPCESSCHVRIRVDELVPDRNALFSALDFEKSMDDQHRISTIVDAVEHYALPWLNKMTNLNGLNEEMDRLNPAMIHEDVLQYISKALSSQGKTG